MGGERGHAHDQVGGLEQIEPPMDRGLRHGDVAGKIGLVEHLAESQSGRLHGAAEVGERGDGGQSLQVALEAGTGVGVEPDRTGRVILQFERRGRRAATTGQRASNLAKLGFGVEDGGPGAVLVGEQVVPATTAPLAPPFARLTASRMSGARCTSSSMT